MMINPAGVEHQVHGNVVQSTSRVLKEQVTFSETTAVASREWGAIRSSPSPSYLPSTCC